MCPAVLLCPMERANYPNRGVFLIRSAVSSQTILHYIASIRVYFIWDRCAYPLFDVNKLKTTKFILARDSRLSNPPVSMPYRDKAERFLKFSRRFSNLHEAQEFKFRNFQKKELAFFIEGCRPLVVSELLNRNDGYGREAKLAFLSMIEGPRR